MVLTRKQDIEEANKEENKLKSKEMKMDNRSCTDVMCCILFAVMLLAMVGVSAFAIMHGDPMKLATPFDSDGNQCGSIDLQEGTVVNGQAQVRDFSNFRYKYFPGLLQAATGNTNNIYDAVCVTECPMNLAPPAQLTLERTVCLTNSEVTSCPQKIYNTT